MDSIKPVSSSRIRGVVDKLHIQDVVTDMEPQLHDIKDLANAVEHIAATAAGRGEDLSPRVASSVSTVADQIVAKVEALEEAWNDVFRHVMQARE